MDIEREFSSWAQFSSILHLFCKENKVNYSPSQFRTVESVNRNHLLTSKLPVKLRYCYVRMLCNHSLSSDDPGSGSQGSGIKQKSTSSCPSFILLTVNKKRTALVIKETCLHHNHKNMDDILFGDSHLDREQSKKANILLTIGVPRHCVHKAILDDTCDNRPANKAGAVDTFKSTVDSEYISFLDEFIAENPSCLLEMVDCHKCLGALYIQTWEMKEEMAQFTSGSLQIVSHKIPESKFTIICLIGVDQNLVTHLFSVLISHLITDSVVQRFMEMFVQNNQGFCDTCKGIVVEFSRENAEFVQALMPQVSVAWSQSFIIGQFKELVERSKSSKTLGDALFKDMMTSASEQEYNRVLKMYLALADADSAKDFLVNWDSYKELWTHHEIASRLGLEHQESTVEVKFINTLKRVESEPTSLKEIIRTLIPSGDFEEGITSDPKDDRRKESSLNSSSAWYRSLCHPYAAEAAVSQIAVADCSEYNIDAQDDMIIVKRLDNVNEFILSAEGISCSCNYYTSRDLPCQHIFAWRKMTGKSYCDLSLIPQKWRVVERILQSSQDNLSHSQADAACALMRTKRVVKIQSIARNILSTCESHTFEELGADLILLKKALNAMRKLRHKPQSNNVEVSSSSEVPSESVSADSIGQSVKENQQTKRGRQKWKAKESISILSHKPSTSPEKTVPTPRRHNLRTNIKHKFVSRSPITTVVEEEKVKQARDSCKDAAMHVEERESDERKKRAIDKSESPNSKRVKRQKLDKKSKDLTGEDELVENEPEDRIKERKEVRAPLEVEANEVNLDSMTKTDPIQNISPGINVRNDQTKTPSHEKSDKLDNDKDAEIDSNNESEESDGDNNDDDDSQSIDDDNESKLQREKDLHAFWENLPPDESQQLIQAISVMDLPIIKTSLLEQDGRACAMSPVQHLITSLERDEEEVDFVISSLRTACPGYDPYTYKVAGCVIVKSFSVGAGVMGMMDTLKDWPSHLPESLKPGDITPAALASDQTLTVCGHKLTSHDLNSLSSDMEYSPKIIHAYLEVLAQRHNGKLFIIPFEVVHHWRKGNFSHMIFKKVHFKTFDFLVLPIHCGSELMDEEGCDPFGGLKPHWMSLVADVRNKTVSVLNPRGEDKYAIAANGYMLQWRRYMQIRSVYTGEMLLTWNYKKIHCSRQMQTHTSGALLLMNVESVISNALPSVMTEGHLKDYSDYVALNLRETDRETTVLCVGGPECQQMAARDADWLQCENCRAWWHRACAGRVDQNHVFYCSSCQQRILSVNSSTNVMCQEEEVEINEIGIMEEEDDEEEEEEEEDKENDESITENNIDDDDDNSKES